MRNGSKPLRGEIDLSNGAQPTTTMRRLSQLLALLAATQPLLAQSPRRIDLTAPDAALSRPFTRITAFRALPDGRVIVADEMEGEVVLADLRSQSVSTIGRRGSGPEEYLLPRGLIPLPNGRTLLQDPGNARFLEIDAEGRIAPQDASRSGRDQMLGLSIAWDVHGSDQSGNIFFEQLPGVLKPAHKATVPIVRWNVQRGGLDTIASYRLTEAMLSQSIESGKPGEVVVRPRAWAARPQWAVTSDGRIALAEPDPYRVVWLDAAGRRAGPPVSFRPQPVTGADREWYLDEMNASQTRVRGARRPSAEPRRPGAAAPTSKRAGEPIFPSSFPAFAGRESVRIDPEGAVWIARAHSVSDTTSLYDVFDAMARRQAEARFPARSRIVGFGDGVIYVARRDEDDLEHLERYRR